jgi:hypothetical protein
MAELASFHLVRGSWRSMVSLATDRRPLRAVDGLELWRLLGTGRGRSTGLGVEPRRIALFAVWRDEPALDRFLAGHPIAARWGKAAESYSVRLRLTSGHGSWRGFGVDRLATHPSSSGPRAVLTRASVAVRAWPRFAASAQRAARSLPSPAEGLLNVCGIGEAPVGRLGTFSLWQSGAAIDRFVAEHAVHRAIAGAARRDGWYREEWFARFEPYGSTGTWDGIDPLAS